MPYVSGRRHHSYSLGGIADLGTSDVLALGQAVWNIFDNPRKLKVGALRDIRTLLDSRFPTPFQSHGMGGNLDQEIAPAGFWPVNKPMNAFVMGAIAAYQRSLLPWFENVLAKAAQIVAHGNFTQHDADGIVEDTVRKAEAALRVWGIDPANVYQQLAQKLNLKPSDLSPTSLARDVAATPDQATVAQSVNQAVLQMTPNIVPPAIISVPSPAQAAADATATPATYPNAFLSPPPPMATDTLQPASIPMNAAPISLATPQTATTVTSGINWDRWAMPLAILAAAFLNAHLGATHSGHTGSGQ